MKANSNNGKLCVLLGHDGSGKSTVLRKLAVLEPCWTCTSADPEELRVDSSLISTIWGGTGHPREYALILKNRARSLFFGLTVMIEEEHVICPALSIGHIVVVDSYFYRFLAKEMVLNPDGSQILNSLINEFHTPDLVLFLDVQPDICFQRKQALSRFEYVGRPDFAGFKLLQESTQGHMRKLTRGIPIATVEGNRSIDAVTENVHNTIRKAFS